MKFHNWKKMSDTEVIATIGSMILINAIGIVFSIWAATKGMGVFSVVPALGFFVISLQEPG